jgi:hypothetical protein
MIKGLFDYLVESEVTNEFRIKFAACLTDSQLDKMELHLRKYDAFDITAPKKTIIQRNPIDFRDLDLAEIYMVDFKTHMSVSPMILLHELTQKMGINEKLIVVKNKTDAMEEEEEDCDDEYEVKLTDGEYSEFDNKPAKKAAKDYVPSEFIKSLNKLQGKKK